MKKALSIILILACLVMTMSSCDLFKKNDVEQQVVEDSPEVAADKAAIIKVLSGVKLGDVFADLGEVTIPEGDYVTEAFEQFENMVAQADVNIEGVGALQGIINKGGAFLYGGPDGEIQLGYALVYTAEAIYAISTSSYGYGVEKTQVSSEDVSTDELQAQVDQYIAMVKQYADLIDGIEIPSLTSSLIKKSGQWYVINSDFMKEVIKSYIIGYVSSQGTELTEEDIASIDETLKNVTINLGFAVNGEKIYGMNVDVKILNGDQTVDINYQTLLDPECTELDKVSVSVKADEGSITVVLDSDSANETVSLSFEYGLADQSIEAEAVVAYDAEANTVESLQLNGTLTMGSNGNATASAVVNFDNIGKANADVLVLDVDVYMPENHGTIDASIKNDADCNSKISVVIATNGVADFNVSGTITYGEAPNAPAEDDFVFDLIENYDVYDAKALEICEAFYAYMTEQGKGGSIYYVTYYDADLGVTIVCCASIGGYYQDVYDDYGNLVGKEFVPMGSYEPLNFYVSEGEFAPDYYDFDATVVDGEFVFAVNENNVDNSGNGDIVGGNEETKDF